MERNQFTCSVSEGMGHHSLCLLRDHPWWIQGKPRQSVPLCRKVRNSLPSERHEHVLWRLQSRRNHQSPHVLPKVRLSHCHHFQPSTRPVQNQLHRKISALEKSETVYLRRTRKSQLHMDRRKSPLDLLQLKHDQILAFVGRWELQPYSLWCTQCW